MSDNLVVGQAAKAGTGTMRSPYMQPPQAPQTVGYATVPGGQVQAGYGGMASAAPKMMAAPAMPAMPTYATAMGATPVNGRPGRPDRGERNREGPGGIGAGGDDPENPYGPNGGENGGGGTPPEEPAGGGGKPPKPQPVDTGTGGQTYGGSLNALNSLIQMLTGHSEEMWKVGFPAYQQAISYYSALLKGGPQGRAMAQMAVAPAAENLAQLGAGSARQINASYMRGGAKDQALADLGREQYGQVASLIRGVQPMAAEALMGGGSTGTGQSFGGLAGGGDLQTRLATLLKPTPTLGGGGGGMSGPSEATLAAWQQQLLQEQQQSQTQKKQGKWSWLGPALGAGLMLL